jgi:Recombination endonuclease VII
MKTCTVCGVEKDESCFGRHACRPDGLRGECRECCAAYKASRPEAIARKAAREKHMRLCLTCKVEPRYVWPGGQKSCYCWGCVKLRNEAAHARRRSDPERWAKVKAYMQEYSKRDRVLKRARELKTGRGLPPGTIESMLEKQGGMCGLCGDKLQEGRLQALDHDHQTGRVRDILCHSCNKGLGGFRDSPERLTKAILYLARHNAKRS